MSHIKFDYSKVLDKFVAPHEVEYMQAQVTAADELIRIFSKTCAAKAACLRPM